MTSQETLKMRRWRLGFFAATLIVALAYAGPVAETDLVGIWQVGLNDSTRNIPAGRAFSEGMTAAVFTFGADKSLRVELPCRHERLIREVGEFVLLGTWELKSDGTLIQALEVKGGQFAGQKKDETSAVSFDRDLLIFTRLDGSRIELGRFNGDTQAACKFE